MQRVMKLERLPPCEGLSRHVLMDDRPEKDRLGGFVHELLHSIVENRARKNIAPRSVGHFHDLIEDSELLILPEQCHSRRPDSDGTFFGQWV